MKAKHRKTLEALFKQPTPASIAFSDMEALIVALGGEIREGEGSRVVFELNGTREYFHRPHPGKDAKKHPVEIVRAWLTTHGVKPC